MKKIFIPGQPSRVTHQSGTRYANRRTYKTAPLIGWEHTLERALEDEVPEQPLEGPILLQVFFGYKAKTKKQCWSWKMTRPDTDNCIKTLKDVMTRMGFWKDDAQVVFEICAKMMVENPGIYIEYDEWPKTEMVKEKFNENAETLPA